MHRGLRGLCSQGTQWIQCKRADHAWPCCLHQALWVSSKDASASELHCLQRLQALVEAKLLSLHFTEQLQQIAWRLFAQCCIFHLAFDLLQWFVTACTACCMKYKSPFHRSLGAS